MTDLASNVIALRAIICWLVGLAVIAGTSAYTARNFQNRPASAWVLPPVMTGQILALLGPIGAVLLIGRASGGWERTLAMLATAGVGILALWFNAIAIQLGQNLAYRLVGHPMQKIRLFAWSGDKKTRRKRP